MSVAPRILVCHERANTYREALEERLSGVSIEAVTRASALDSGRSNAPILLAWQLPPGALRNLTGLRWIQVTGAGVDHFLRRDDLPEEVTLTRSLARFGVQVAEYTIAYLLHHLVGVAGYRSQQHERRWEQHPRPLLTDMTFGIVGLGSLGLPTAAALSGLGARVLGVRRSKTPAAGVDRVFSIENWREMLPLCDALLITAPRTPDTIGLIDAEALAALPEGAVVVNVARGDIIDEEALLAALDSGHLGAAILDVFAREPLPENHPLWSHRRAWVTPHIAAPSEIGPVADEFAANYRLYLRGEALNNVVDRGRGY